MKNVLRMSISKKIGLAFTIIAFMLVMASVSGFISTKRLSSSLEYITGPAWNTADGAMEGVIGIEAQIIAINELTNNARVGVKVDVSSTLKEAIDTADEALGRMFAAKQIPGNLASETKVILDAFKQKRDAVLDSTDSYIKAYKAMQANGQSFVRFMGYLEEVGDGAVEELEKNPGKSISWNSGLREKWEAADGSMEARIALLERLFYYQEMADHIIERKYADKRLAETLEDLKGNVKQLSALKAFSTTIPGGEFKGQVFKTVLQKLASEHEKTMTNLIVQYDQFSSSVKAFREQSKVILDKIEVLEESADGAVEGEMANINSIISSSYSLISIAMIIGLLITLGSIMVSYLYISKPLKRVACNMHDISEGSGDLSVRLDMNSSDEIGDIARGFNVFVGKIQEIVLRVSETATLLGAAVERVSSMTGQSSSSISQQQLETQQVATAINEMSATVAEVARSASNASNSANEAQRATNEGHNVVKNAVNTMQVLANEVENAADVINKVENDSNEIGTVLDVIRGIAEQTNLLALNAAIEAARAGEQGRGFAVVADEVRTLASRTQSSTEEIQRMIENLQSSSQQAVSAMTQGREQASHGVEQVNQAGDELNRITQAVNIISDMNAQIASASEEQSSVAEEVNRSVVNINQITDENSSTFSQIVNATNDIENLASELRHLVAQFKT